MDAELVDLLDGGATLLTPNRRLAADLAARHARARRMAGAAAWRTADILPLAAWVQRCTQRVVRDEGGVQALASVQEQVLWQLVLSEHASAFPLMDIAAAARLAREAHRLALAWRLPLAAHAGMLSEDCAAFLRWRARYQRRCREEGWIDSGRAGDLLVDAIDRGALPLERGLVAYGFDALTPQDRALLEAARRRGRVVRTIGPAPVPASVSVMRCDDQRDEWEQVAHAVRGILECDPVASIGVVVPTLSEDRSKLLRTFDDVLDPARALRFDRGPRPCNASAGEPLSHQPPIHAALSILRLAHGAVPWDEMGSLLRSPFVGDAESERGARAALDAHLRQVGMMELDAARLADVLRRTRGDAPHACPRLARRLDAWLEQTRQCARGRRAPSAWGAQIAALLAGFGWPGERTLDSEEHQALEKWHDLLGQLAHLDALLGAIDFATLRGHLARLAGDTTFQAESQGQKVQILGVLESAGLVFDHLFVTGLHDEAWPQTARPNPFLPAELQRAHGVPHASAEWEAGFARRTLAAWTGAAARVHLSHPSREGDRRLLPSALLGAFAPAPPPSRPRSYARDIFSSALAEQVEESAAPPLPANWDVAVGSVLFADQAACPFRAFVLHRLAAQPLQEPVPGLDARRRGSLLHDVLHRLWQQWRTQARMAASPAGQLRATIAQAIDAALDALQARRPDLVTPAFRRLEHVRLRELIERLLDLERQRAAFTVVDGEVRSSVAFAGLQLNTRIDRIDRLDDDALVVLDYKTGRTGVANWYGARPDDPQLPLYAVLQSAPVAAVAFVALRSDGVAFKGLSGVDHALPGVRAARPEECDAPDWPALLVQWRATLERLAGEFVDGVAHIDPKHYPQTCQYCPLDALCRVRELLDGASTDDEGAGDA